VNKLIKVSSKEDIPPEYRDTPVGLLLEYHNFNRSHAIHTKADILIGMCMDNRKYLRIPENFAYIIRTGGGNLRYNEFQVSYAIAVGQVKAIALLVHNHCGMVNLMSKKEQFIEGLIENTGWERERAEEHFIHFAPMFEISNEIDFGLIEAQRLRLKYPKILVSPLFYRIEDNLLYFIEE